jgi:hypothetical protein
MLVPFGLVLILIFIYRDKRRVRRAGVKLFSHPGGEYTTTRHWLSDVSFFNCDPEIFVRSFSGASFGIYTIFN